MEELRVTINGAGAAGIAVTKLLLGLGIGDVVLCDRQGAIYEGRVEHMDFSKEEIARLTNKQRRTGSLGDVITGSDVFIGLSAGGVLTPQMVRTMAPNPLVFALANPVPEITPDLAREAGALAVATGRSDYPNQVNNSLAFPGVFRGALDVKARTIDDAMKIAAARAIADLVDATELSPDFLIPDSLDLRVAPRVAAAVAEAAISGDLAHNPLDPREVEMRCRDLVYEGTVGL
jgi:malate dehydrogenase (oxaloacetate-decarboxylating)